MSVEVFGAVLAGVLAGSLALAAFGADSSIELISSTVVLSHLRSDAEGREGRGRSISRLTNLLLFSLIPTLGGIGAYSFLSGVRPEGTLLGVAVATGAVIVMPFLWYEKRRIGKQTRCLPLSIDAFASATCFLMSVTLLAGLLAEYLWGIWWADYVATVAIMAFIGREALESRHEIRVESLAQVDVRSPGLPPGFIYKDK
jgi:divalent metal cation (Fe/Co/Zn/Cd) transporter